MNQASSQPVKRKQALRERNLSGITGRVCDRMSSGRWDFLLSPLAQFTTGTFASTPHAFRAI